MRFSSARDPWLHHLPRLGDCADYYDWLVHFGSLTERIRARCSAFRVRVVRQGLARPFTDERVLLGLAAHELAWVREVVLCCGDSPLVFAHTVLPRHNVRGAWNLFAGLGARPLGEILFTDPRVTRQPLHYRPVGVRHPLQRAAVAATGTQAAALWARRSLFHRAGRAILVSEAFLPDILELPREGEPLDWRRAHAGLIDTEPTIHNR